MFKWLRIWWSYVEPANLSRHKIRRHSRKFSARGMQVAEPKQPEPPTHIPKDHKRSSTPPPGSFEIPKLGDISRNPQRLLVSVLLSVLSFSCCLTLVQIQKKEKITVDTSYVCVVDIVLLRWGMYRISHCTAKLQYPYRFSPQRYRREKNVSGS